MDDTTKVKKVTHLGGKPGENRATVTEEIRNAQTLRAKHAKELLEKAGAMHMPDNFEFCGAAAVFYYAKKGIEGPIFTHACQLAISGVDEGHAGLGLQTLRQNLMQAYGHEERSRG